jgi:hypothetical protein
MRIARRQVGRPGSQTRATMTSGVRTVASTVRRRAAAAIVWR